jgi:hypothetical protein
MKYIKPIFENKVEKIREVIEDTLISEFVDIKKSIKIISNMIDDNIVEFVIATKELLDLEISYYGNNINIEGIKKYQFHLNKFIDCVCIILKNFERYDYKIHNYELSISTKGDVNTSQLRVSIEID